MVAKKDWVKEKEDWCKRVQKNPLLRQTERCPLCFRCWPSHYGCECRNWLGLGPLPEPVRPIARYRLLVVTALLEGRSDAEIDDMIDDIEYDIAKKQRQEKTP